MEHLDALEEKLGITFNNKGLVEEAFTHVSYANRNSKKNNDRMEFLGDSVLNLIISNILMERKPSGNSGDLTVLREILVNNNNLAEYATKLSLTDLLKTEYNTPINNSILADTFEALVAAIYLDKGLEQTKQVVCKLFATQICSMVHRPTPVDPKNKLQQVVQTKGSKPEYTVTKVVKTGVHQQVVHACVRDGSKVLGVGTGPTKKCAEKAAAIDALKKRGLTFDLRAGMIYLRN